MIRKVSWLSSSKSSWTKKKDFPKCALFHGDSKDLLLNIGKKPLFNLIITSPPYNIGKEYETRRPFSEYLDSQELIISLLVNSLVDGGSICWQVGNFVENNQIYPLDIYFDPIFRRHNLQLRNRIIWHYGHGLHCTSRFSGRYETILWYTKCSKQHSSYAFNLDAVRKPSKYPAKKRYKGSRIGHFSSNPNGKNPEDVWSGSDFWDNIPNVKGNHIEKTSHPCQFPVGLVERLVLALSDTGDLVFDPFCGSGSTGVASLIHKRLFWGCDTKLGYLNMAKKRLLDTRNNEIKYRPHLQPIYDHTKSNLSIHPFQNGDK